MKGTGYQAQQPLISAWTILVSIQALKFAYNYYYYNLYNAGAMPIILSPIIVTAICGLTIIIIMIFIIIITYCAFCVMIRWRQRTSKETTHGAVGPVRWRGSCTQSDDEDTLILPLDDSCSTELIS